MSFPLAKLLIIAKPKGYTRNQVLTFAQAYGLVSQTIKESNLSQDENAELMEKFIEEELKPRGFNNNDSFTILTLLGELYDSDDPLQNELPEREEQEDTEESSSSSLNVVGKFMMNNDDGSPKMYYTNDVVYYEGKTYIATDNVTSWVPESTHPENMWKPIDLPDNTIDGEEF